MRLCLISSKAVRRSRNSAWLALQARGCTAFAPGWPSRLCFGASIKLTSKQAAINHRKSERSVFRHPRRSAAADAGCLSRRLPRMKLRIAKFAIGQIVKHRKYPFRGIVYDVDPVFANTEEWWQSIPPELRPRKDQPFYHLRRKRRHRICRLCIGAKSHSRYIRRIPFAIRK
jgi:Hemimethylated DNA-binding protein YccV like